MILVDYTQIAIGSLMVALQRGKDLNMDLVRHITLNNLRFYRTKFKEMYGELVICCDSRHYCRRDYFPNYKANRKKDREASGQDWDAIFETLNSIRDELKEFFPYKVVDVYGAEADDIIAVVIHERAHGRSIIISSDKDFIQLHGLNVEQFSPVTKKMVNNKSPSLYLKEHILKGDRSDSIPNILSADDTFVTEKRQKPIRKAVIAELLEQMKKYDPQMLHTLANCSRDTWIRNWQRNETLIDLTKIPRDIVINILEEYDSVLVGKRSELFNYFVEKKLTDLIDRLGEY